MDIIVAVVPSMDGKGGVARSPVGVVVVSPAPELHPKCVDRATTGLFQGDEETIQVLLLATTPLSIDENSEYHKRKDKATAYHDLVGELECFGARNFNVSFPMIQTVADVKNYISPRQRIHVRLNYNGTHQRRYIWLPEGASVSNTRGTPTDKYAIGCTCRDMMWRGADGARSGCKHIIAWNLFRDEDAIQMP